jgi:creatinine amidohydrolase
MTVTLHNMKSPEIKKRIDENSVLILPTGATEQHGPHLATKVDIFIPEQIAQRAAEITGSVVAPSINYGYNEKELAFPGTASVTINTFQNYVFEVCRSYWKTGFKKILILNGHRGNRFIVCAIVNLMAEHTEAQCAGLDYYDLVKDIIKDVRESPIGGMQHACEFETSVMLYLEEKNVDMLSAVAEYSPYLGSKYTDHDISFDPIVFMTAPFHKRTKSGILGDPTIATKEKGKALFEGAVERLAEFITYFKTFSLD